MYKYKSTCRFKMLIFVNNNILEIRPNQIITRETPLRHELLREVKGPSEKSKIVQPKKKKRVSIDSSPKKSHIPLSDLTIVSSNDNAN